MCIIKRDDNVKNKEEGLYCLLLVLCKECIISSQKGSIISCTCRSLHLLNQLKLAQYVYHSLYAQLTKKKITVGEDAFNLPTQVYLPHSLQVVLIHIFNIPWEKKKRNANFSSLYFT
jgi:hypothetical protein